LQKFQSLDNCAVINNYTVIPKYSEGIVPVRIPRMYPAEEVLLEPFKNNTSPVLVAGSLSVVRNGIAYIRVLYFQPNSVILKKNLKIANITFPAAVSSVTAVQKPIKVAEKLNEVTQEVLDDFIKQYKININEKLSATEKLKF